MKPLSYLAAGLILVSTSIGQEAQDLFVPLDSTLTEDFTQRDEVLTSSAIAVRSDLLAQSASRGSGRFSLGTLEGKARVATFESVQSMPEGGLVWTGRIEGTAHSIVNFSLVGDAVAGSIRFDHTLLRIDPDATQPGVHALVLIDEDQFDPCGTGPEHEIALAGATDTGGGVYGTSGLLVDVLVAYSPQARAAQGGTNGINALINLAVTETNQSYGNSDVELRMRLVGTVETNQSETSDMGQVLSRLRSTSDGWYDEVHGLRTDLGADFVAMIVNGGSYCGIGYLMTNVSDGFKSNAFTVTKRSCATGYYSFGHEIGHNMGCAHDRQNAGNAAYNYSYGYRTPNNAYRTVMAYSPGTRVPYYSSPDVTYAGFPMGIAAPASNSADNGRSIDTAAPTTSGWYCSQPEVFGFGAFTSQFQELRLDFSGQPLANGSGNFTLDVSNGIPGQFGLVFYGMTSVETPFLGGYLYVGQPQVRMAPQQVDGSGNATFDWISHAQPSVGDRYYMQFWMRDPIGNPSGDTSAVSNGVSAEVCN